MNVISPFIGYYILPETISMRDSISNTRLSILRDWSLITGRGGYKTGGGGGHMKFYPYEKGGRKRF